MLHSLQPRQSSFSSLWRLALATFLVHSGVAEAADLIARAASVTGQVMLSNGNGAPPFALTRGYGLNPGDWVDTRPGGRVVISLTDGSAVVVQPGTVLMIKDYRAASSLRELFDIVLGTVRVRINHLGGRPNPYRLNSPTASIAVRGTEFNVIVGSEGDTNVEVFEGAVEVSSFGDGGETALIEPGGGVLVRPGQGLQLYGVRAAREIAQRGVPQGSVHSQQPTQGKPNYSAGNSSHINRESGKSSEHAFTRTMKRADNKTAQAAAATQTTASVAPAGSAYERYIASLSNATQLTALYRFNAFADNHLDSLENPAYASSFEAGEGNLVVAPAYTRTSSGDGRTAEYGIAPQLTFFQPVLRNRLFFGVSLSSSQFGSGLFSSLSSSGSSTPSFNSRSSATTPVFSALTAVRLGGSSSVGVAFERLRGLGSSDTETALTGRSGESLVQRTAYESNISQTRITAGWTTKLRGEHQAGVYVRRGSIDGESGVESGSGLLSLASAEGSRSWGSSTEVGMRLRGPLRSNLHYGVAASLFRLSLTGDSLGDDSAPAARERGQRGSLAFGLGYALNRRTLFSFDTMAGVSSVGAQDTRFASLHAAVHRDLTRRLFASGSWLKVWQSAQAGVTSAADSSVTRLLLTGVAPGRSGGRLGEAGFGWRFSPDLSVQYLYSSYRQNFSSATHLVSLRYTFKLPRH